MVENLRGLLLQTERLWCHLAGICAVTVLAGLTETEDSHGGAGLMGLEYDLHAVTTCWSLMLIFFASTMSSYVCCFHKEQLGLQ